MDAVIAQTCSVVAFAMVTVWAIVAAEKSKEDLELEQGKGAPRCAPDVCEKTRCRGITEESAINPQGGYCGY